MEGALGVGLMVWIVYTLSESRDKIRWRSVYTGIGLQLLLALFFLKVPAISNSLLALNHIIYAIESATITGASFVFGYLGGGNAPFEILPGSSLYIFGFRVLPQILVFSALVAVLWHWTILPRFIDALGSILQKILKVSGALGAGSAATIFLGLVESPLVIRGYLSRLSRSDLFVLMVCSMSTVAGSVMILYANILIDILPGALGHVLAASILNVIGAIILARILIPSEGSVLMTGKEASSLGYSNTMDAITQGTSDGLRLVLNIAAMLIVLISLVALVNQMLSIISWDNQPLTLQRIAGWLFAPIAWLIGIPWAESVVAGSLLGSKLILNELVAFIDLAAIEGNQLSDTSRIVMTYALCGFANFGSLGILLGGYTILLPDRKREVLDLGIKTLALSTLVNFNTGAIVSLVLFA
ncbi:MAG: nucleoside:proton symporter [Gammaproteobacteria bacterium]|nr:nucleoside:proton symporter [Gammaproteobacteria bacterium]